MAEDQLRPPRRRRRLSPLRIVALVMTLLLVLVAGYGIWEWQAAQSAWGKINRVDATPSGDRPSPGKGKNYLLVGSDSREGMSIEDIRRLHTGTNEGKRADSMMVVHLPDSGKPTIVSLPRDSWVKIPGHASAKLNAAYPQGGPKLLMQTIEANTGLHMDGYLEIGFGGFAKVVDSVGGVQICVKQPMKDKDAHIDLKAGCQNLDGAQALGYVRARKCGVCANDFGRMQRQREFLGALAKKLATWDNIMLPWRLDRIGGDTLSVLTVDQDASMMEVYHLMQALRGASTGGATMLQVPNNGGGYMVHGQDAVKWDPTLAPMLFQALREDRDIAAEITKAGLAGTVAKATEAAKAKAKATKGSGKH